MYYIKTFDAEDRLTGAEKIEVLVYVRWQSNGMLVRCTEEEAQGIIGEDNETIYLINGNMPHGEKEPYAEFITKEEYDQIKGGDPEDEDPEIPDDTDEDEVLTRAELTEKVKELEGRNDFLEECLLEMSEVVYAGE